MSSYLTFEMWGSDDYDFKYIRNWRAKHHENVRAYDENEVFFLNQQDEFYVFSDKKKHHFVQIFIKINGEIKFLGWLKAIIKDNIIMSRQYDDKIYDFRKNKQSIYYWKCVYIGKNLYFGYYKSPNNRCEIIDNLPEINKDETLLKKFLIY